MSIHLEPGEIVIKEVREHIFFLILDTLSYIVLCFAPIIFALIFLVIPLIYPNLFPLTELIWSAWPLYPLWLIVIGLQIAKHVTFYFLHYLMITNQRVIEVEQRGYFNREVSSFRLEHIQDITIVSAGILASIINYGDIHLQTASKQNDFRIARAPYPEQIKSLILDQEIPLERGIRGLRDVGVTGYASEKNTN